MLRCLSQVSGDALACRRQFQAPEFFRGSLSGRIELPHGIDLISKQLNSSGRVSGIGPNIENSSAPAELTAIGDDTCRVVSDPQEEFKQLLNLNRLTNLEFPNAGAHLIWRKGDCHNSSNRGQDDGPISGCHTGQACQDFCPLEAGLHTPGKLLVEQRIRLRKDCYRCQRRPIRQFLREGEHPIKSRRDN